MKAVKQHVHGKVMGGSNLSKNGRVALLLTDPAPKTETAASLYLRFALVTIGTEELIWPSFVLDDWGNERRSLELYDWVRQHGNEFPRAEVFGFEQDGRRTQCFMRELELYSKLPCYLFATKETPLTSGVPVQAILLPDESVTQPEKMKPPSYLKRPLRSANVSWWRVNPAITEFDLIDIP